MLQKRVILLQKTYYCAKIHIEFILIIIDFFSQTDAIYEQALVTAMKPKAEMIRPHMYTM